MAEQSEQLTPPEILRLKDQIQAHWQQLPAEHRATMALVLLADVLGGQYRVWMLEAMARRSAQLSAEPNQPSKPLKLIDAVTRAQLPPPFTPEGEKPSALAQAKLVASDGARVWYVSAFDGDDLCFGLTVETEIAFDYFSLSELQRLGGVERDLTFTPQTLATLQTDYERRLME